MGKALIVVIPCRTRHHYSFSSLKQLICITRNASEKHCPVEQYVSGSSHIDDSEGIRMARSVFDKMTNRHSKHWSGMICVYMPDRKIVRCFETVFVDVEGVQKFAKDHPTACVLLFKVDDRKGVLEAGAVQHS